MKVKKIIKILMIFCLCIAILILSFSLIFVIKSINEVEDLNLVISSNFTKLCEIYDKNNNIINDNMNINNSYVKLDEINQDTIDAFISIEDKQFYQHNGINIPRIFKSMLVNIKDRKFSQGASTITQQLIKNLYLNNEKSLSRKIKEVYLAIKLESKEDKNKILESYLNNIYYGNGAYGIGNASYRFFGKKPSELTLSESCIIAGTVNYPFEYSPLNNIEKSIKRRNLILKEMLQDSKITNEEYENALNEEVIINKKDIVGINDLDLYSKNVLSEASQLLGISENEILHKNYKIYTYQDNKIQECLNEIINNEKYYEKNQYNNIPDSLSMILDNKSGGVCAVSGKSEYNLTNFKRQPGSLIKPVIIYTPALEEKIIYPCSEILDEEKNFESYHPQNVGNKYYGYQSIKDCIAKSLNIPSVVLCKHLGIEKCKAYGEMCGLKFNKEYDNGLAISLGGLTDGVTLKDITESYLPFSNSGNFKESKYIFRIFSPNNLKIYENKLSETHYCSADNAYLMTNMLKYATKHGTSKKLGGFSYDIAGKTGTVSVKDSNLNTDAYSLAYTSKHTMSVWLGNYTMKEEYNLNGSNNGGTYATEIIRDTFDKIYNNNEPEDFGIPDTIIEIPIDLTLLNENHDVFSAYNLPARYQKYELFSSSHIPTESSNNINNTNDINFKILINDNITLSFDCREYFNYSIIRIDKNNNEKLIKKVKNHSGKYLYIDNEIIFNDEYKYYILVSSDYSDINCKSTILKGKINKNYNNLLSNNDSISWLFA